MGLLDGFGDFLRTPEGQGLLSATFGGLAGARRGAPLNSLGTAGLAGLQGYSGALDRNSQLDQNAQMAKYRDAQMQDFQAQADQRRAKLEQDAKFNQGAGQFFKPGQAAIPPLLGDPSAGIMPSQGRAAVAPSIDREGLGMFMAQNGKLSDGLSMLTPKESDYKVVDGNLVQIGPNGVKPVFTAPQKPAALPSAVQEYQFAKEQGYPGTFQQWSLEGKRAGATNVSTRIENKMGDSLAGQVGPMVKDTYTAAQGAVQQVDAANRIIKAVDSGKIIAGPFAGGRLQVAQIGQILGINGKDDADTIARSREVIRGLSEMTLQGRKQMSGQGAITESEGKLAEKANSGDITDLTPAEIKQLARASARASKFIYSQHQDNLTNLQSDPQTAKLAGFYKVRPMPNVDTGEAPAVNVDDLVNKYRSK